jgi:hypothetical protein
MHKTVSEIVPCFLSFRTCACPETVFIIKVMDLGEISNLYRVRIFCTSHFSEFDNSLFPKSFICCSILTVQNRLPPSEGLK